MNDHYQPENKAALLAVIQETRSHLDSLIQGLSENRKVLPGVSAEWSIKDIMAHISAWERLAQDRIHAALTGETFKFPVIEGDNFVDEFNSGVYERSKNAPLVEVEDEYHACHLDFIDQIKALDEDFLQQKLPFDWAGDLTTQILISANTHWHYPEHAASIQAWLKATK